MATRSAVFIVATTVAPVPLVATAGLAAIATVSTIALMHDLLHGSLGLSRRVNDVLLAVSAAVLLESGHALQRTHRRHHRWFPDLDRDPEAAFACRGGVLRALAEGPVYRYRLWWWAWRHEQSARRLIGVEAGIHMATIGFATSQVAPAVTTYVVLVELGSWLFPLVSVLGVHAREGDDVFTRTRTLRGRVLPALLCNQGFHLEHHLWPMVPSSNLGELSRRAHRLLISRGAPIARTPEGLRQC